MSADASGLATDPDRPGEGGAGFRLRVAAYAVVLDGDRLLLAHWNEGGHTGWTMPGGGLEPGEDPADAAVREVREETGYDVELDGLLGVDSVTGPSVTTGEQVHSIRIVYRARVVGGALADEVDGSTDGAAWVGLADVDGLDRVGLVDAARAMAGLD